VTGRRRLEANETAERVLDDRAYTDGGA